MKKAIFSVVLITIYLWGNGFKPKSFIGIGTYYAKKFEGRKTATGERFRGDSLTAASNWFKLQTIVKVTNLKNGNEVIVRINDRMGNRTRLIDLSTKCAKILGFYGQGVTKVKVENL